ncbi:serine O-acetyltransferase [Colwellia sp. MB3u-55]|jgi:serine O-acetyltransferase|uniref:serine O-acetyltransferase n=1 Tax=Colwellia sp. MB3u-55 TaxID=2759810 RepID=UPI0015F6078C|nr:serine acetyltransferase [Colwellia sp. MB3u-55]MBA6253765.1 serine acetyltransferase [Colwellia sp. MB3u-55]
MSVTNLYRIGNWLHRHHVPFAATFFKALIRLFFNCAVDPSTQIGKGTFFAYGGIAVVVHKNAIIGENVTISQSVTIGGRSNQNGVPVIGDDVYIGAGAIVIGKITIGNNAVIGAGAVVIKDVEIGEVCAGVPARSISK